jgi:hypothetical protein
VFQALGIRCVVRFVEVGAVLWKGKREAALELNVIDEIAVSLGVSRWDVFERQDSTFERFAAGGRNEFDKASRNSPTSLRSGHLTENQGGLNGRRNTQLRPIFIENKS